jgi:hypothetical protein
MPLSLSCSFGFSGDGREGRQAYRGWPVVADAGVMWLLGLVAAGAALDDARVGAVPAGRVQPATADQIGFDRP